MVTQYEMYHAENDADLCMVQTTVAASRTKVTVVVGDDTDPLIGLLFRA